MEGRMDGGQQRAAKGCGEGGESEDSRQDVLTSTSDLKKKSHPFINVVCAVSQSTEEVFTK